MNNNVEKTFEERLSSLKHGCIILGISQILLIISFSIWTFFDLFDNLLLLIIPSVIIILILFFIYKYTKEKNNLGPLLENILGIIILIISIPLALFIIIEIFNDEFFALGIAIILFDIVYIISLIEIFKEASYFKKYIQNK